MRLPTSLARYLRAQLSFPAGSTREPSRAQGQERGNTTTPSTTPTTLTVAGIPVAVSPDVPPGEVHLLGTTLDGYPLSHVVMVPDITTLTRMPPPPRSRSYPRHSPRSWE